MAFLISFGVQITPHFLSIVSLTVMPILKTITVFSIEYSRYITIFQTKYVDYIPKSTHVAWHITYLSMRTINKILKTSYKLRMKRNNVKLFKY